MAKLRYTKTLFALVVGHIAVITAGAARGPDGPYLCIVEQATGFAFDKQSKSWRQRNFRAGEKYVLKRVKKDSLNELEKKIADTPNPAWGVWTFGDYSAGDAFCAEDVDEHGYLWCRGVEQIFNVNMHSRRFLRTYAGSYVQDPSEFPDEKADTPVIEIGKCTGL